MRRHFARVVVGVERVGDLAETRLHAFQICIEILPLQRFVQLDVGVEAACIEDRLGELRKDREEPLRSEEGAVERGPATPAVPPSVTSGKSSARATFTSRAPPPAELPRRGCPDGAPGGSTEAAGGTWGIAICSCSGNPRGTEAGYPPVSVLMMSSVCAMCSSVAGTAAWAPASSCSAWLTSCSVPTPPFKRNRLRSSCRSRPFTVRCAMSSSSSSSRNWKYAVATPATRATSSASPRILAGENLSLRGRAGVAQFAEQVQLVRDADQPLGLERIGGLRRRLRSRTMLYGAAIAPFTCG